MKAIKQISFKWSDDVIIFHINVLLYETVCYHSLFYSKCFVMLKIDAKDVVNF